MLNVPAASAAPVEPAHTSACALPSATARVACTIEACGVERTAATGSAAFAIDTGASTTAHPRPLLAELACGAEQQHLRAARGRDRGPSGDLGGTQVGAVASTATTSPLPAATCSRGSLKDGAPCDTAGYSWS